MRATEHEVDALLCSDDPKQTVPNASIHVNGMNCNSYHFQMSPLKHFTYLPSLGWHQLLKMFGDPSFMEQALGHMQAYQRILL